MINFQFQTYAVMEYAGEFIPLYESMASTGTIKTYNDITALVSSMK